MRHPYYLQSSQILLFELFDAETKSSNSIVEELQKTLSNKNNTKVLRFLLNCLSGTPVAGGGFSATAGLWAEIDQDKINKMTKLAVAICQ